MKSFCTLSVFIILIGCSSKPLSYNQRKVGHEKLYSLPEVSSPSIDSDQALVNIIFIKDINKIKMSTLTYPDTKETIKVSGVDIFKKYLSIAKKKLGKETFILNGGGYLNESIGENKKSVRFLNQIKVESNALSFEDFAVHPISYIALKIKHLDRRTILTNMLELSKMQNVEIRSTKPVKIIKTQGLKIGVINIIDPEVLPKKSVYNTKGMIIEETFESLVKYSLVAKSQGADIVIAHLETNTQCIEERAKSLSLPFDKINFDPKQLPCKNSFKIKNLITMLPKDSIDVVLVNSRNTKEKFNNFINDTLVLSHFGDGNHFSMAQIVIDKNKNRINKKKTNVIGTIRTCHNFNEKTQDCYTDDSKNPEVKIIPAKFLGQELTTK